MNIPKYRAWHKHLKKMMPVLEIDLDPESGGVFIKHDNMYVDEELNNDFWPWSDIELMQWTGRKDKNGTDIYEDDLLVYRYHSGIECIYRAVIGEHIHDVDGQSYAYYGLYFIWDNETTTGMGTEHVSLSKMEVIGNIWENSNLLQEPQS